MLPLEQQHFIERMRKIDKLPKDPEMPTTADDFWA